MSMSRFKDLVERDIHKTFLNIDFFGEIHCVEGTEIPIVIDDDILKSKQSDLAVAESAVLFYAHSCDLKRKPVGELLNIDGREYIIDDWAEDMGVSTVTLSANITA